MPDQSIPNAAGAFGLPLSGSALGQVGMFAKTIECVAAATVTAGNVVALSTTEGQIVPAATNQNINCVIGVAVDNIASGGVGRVAIGGMVTGAKKDNTVSVVQFDLLTISAAVTAGFLSLAGSTAITQVKDTGKVFAIALAAQTTGDATVDVFIIPKL